MHVMAGAQHEFSQICKNLKACLYALKMLSPKNAGPPQKTGSPGSPRAQTTYFCKKKNVFLRQPGLPHPLEEIPRGMFKTYFEI